MDVQEVTESLDNYKRKSKRQRTALVLVILLAVAAIIAFLIYSLRRTKASDAAVAHSDAVATAASKSVDAIATDALKRIQGLDEQGNALANGDDPTVYLWRTGLTVKPRDQATSIKLAALLNSRRYLIGDAGPLLSASPQMTSYVCDHMWYVVGESVAASRAQQFLADQIARDPRYAIAEAGAGALRPDQAAIIVGFFLRRADAQRLANEIKVNTSDIRAWSFGDFQPPCDTHVPSVR